VEWPRQVEVESVRARWVYAQWSFSPLAGWPPPRPRDDELKLPDRLANSAEVAAALGILASRPEYWEAQAQVVGYCSETAGDPAPQWLNMAGLGRAEFEQTSEGAGISEFLSRSALVVPRPALIGAAQTISLTFRPETLDGVGYFVGLLAGPDWEECMDRCRNEPDPMACFIRCSAGN